MLEPITSINGSDTQSIHEVDEDKGHVLLKHPLVHRRVGTQVREGKVRMAVCCEL